MSNPFLNDKAMKSAADAGWAAPDPATRETRIDDGPISPWRPGVMTVGGTMTATGVLMVLLLASAAVGWMNGPSRDAEATGFPGLALVGMLVGFGCAIVTAFKPTLARILGPIYALAQGFFLGVVSKAYENFQSGIVIQAIGATLGVFLVMLVLYRTRIIRVTSRFRSIIMMATFGLMIFYAISFVIRLIAGADSVSFLYEPSLLGIGFSIFAAGLAAMNLALDFDFIERGAKEGLPKGMEWFAALGLVITLVWLYLELLRLLSKLQQR
jgi:uncharacterized YccA/Bax inhibitor family protein